MSVKTIDGQAKNDTMAAPLRGRQAPPSLKTIGGRTPLFLILVLWACTTVIPLLWMVLSSSRTTKEILTQPFSWPTALHLENFIDAWNIADLGTALVNSLLVSLGSVVIATFCSMLIGFSLSRGGIPWSDKILTFFLIGLMIPVFCTLVPLLILFQDLNLVNTYYGLSLVYAGFSMPLGILLFKNAFDVVPGELVDSAMIDGCSVPVLLARIFMPLVTSTTVTYVVLTFLNGWNDFVFALVLISDTAHRTLPLALMSFSGEHGTDYGQLFAALTISTVPTLLIYLLFQDRIQASMSTGAIK